VQKCQPHACLFHFVLELAIRKFKENWRRFNSNGAQVFLVCAGDVNLLEEQISLKKPRALLDASKNIFIGGKYKK
jgi:hypothetical protein